MGGLFIRQAFFLIFGRVVNEMSEFVVKEGSEFATP